MTDSDIATKLRATCEGAVARSEGTWSSGTEDPVTGQGIYEFAKGDTLVFLGTRGVAVGTTRIPYSDLLVRPPSLKEMLAATQGEGGTLRMIGSGIDHAVTLPSLAFVAVLNALYKVARTTEAESLRKKS